ncbi:TPA: relaxase/mobilization nuclease domain-containing protein [Escherichia coli]|nr:relaxase/mobilization nuclease domain-containing protein [Escherichia coli]HDS3454408.1 relaxase/mobilization nuclease domain-containing protein [Escherichia coli]HDW0064492.1 relaxase/mobilization nuclease domain-containing protein [Escherichia coli]
MISRHIPMRNVKKSSFVELAKYLQDPQSKQERVGVIKVTNCHQENILDAARYDIEPTQRLNTRSESDKTYHLIVSFRPGENPSQEVLDAAEERICAAMGYADHQRVSAVHYDTDNVHIHIAINKIHPETHNIHTPYNDYKTRSAVCLALEKEFGLESDNHQATKTRSENHAADMERHSGRESLLGWIKRECADQLRNANSWQELHQAMRENGLELRQKGNGFVITGPDGIGVKASSVDRVLSRASLEKKFGLYEPAPAATETKNIKPLPDAIRQRFASAAPVKKPGDRPPPMRENRLVNLGDIPAIEIKSGKRYEGRPLGNQSASSSELYGRYQSEQQKLTAARNEALRLAKANRDRLIENAKRTGRLKRSAIKLLKGPGVNKRYLYGLVSKALGAELERVNAKYKKDRQAAYDIHKRRTWADWLQFKAGAGDDEALKTLRQRNAQAARKEANLVHGEKIKQDGRIPGLKADSVTKEGTIIYRVGESAIRDGGKRLDVSRDAGDDGLHAALLMAKHRYGNKLTVNGSFDFKKRIVAVAAARELDVSFADPELEKLRQILSKKAARNREYIQVPFEQKDKARKAGAMWDNDKKSWFVGPYTTREQIEKFIRLNEEKDNEQRRERHARSERADAGRERRGYGSADAAAGRRTATDAGTGNARGRGRTGTGDGSVAGAGEYGRPDGARSAGRSAESVSERGHRKPHVARPGRQPPPSAKNRLRAMSELGMVRFTGRSEVLLPGNVSDHLEYQRAQHNDQLRRNPLGGGVTATTAEQNKPLTGADKYVAEREEKRRKGFDIPKHRRYNSSDKGQYEYAGQRKSGQETLALLKRDEEIVVMPVSDYTARRLSSVKVGEPVSLTASGSVRKAKGRGR